MNVYGKLVKAQLEDSASDLSPASTGLIYFNTVSTFLKYYNASTWKTLVDTDSIQTLTNKYTPILRGGTSSFGSMELRSTDHADKGAVNIKDGSVLAVSGSGDTVGDAWNLGFPRPSGITVASNSSNPVPMVCGYYGTNPSSISQTFQFITTRGDLDPGTQLPLQTNDVIFSIAGFGGNYNSEPAYTASGSIKLIVTENHNPAGGLVGGAWYFRTATTGVATSIQNRLKLDSDAVWIMSPGGGNGTPHLRWAIDNIGDIGVVSGQRPRTIYSATSFQGPLLKLTSDNGSTYVGLQPASPTTSNVTYKLPPADGTVGQVLSTDGSGNLSWSSSGGGGSVSSYASTWTSGMGAGPVVFTHSLGSTNIDVSFVDLSDNTVMLVDTVVVTNANNITVTASEAPSVSGWRVVVQA